MKLVPHQSKWIFSFISDQLLHGVYLIGVSLDKPPIIISKPQKAHQLCICLGCLSGQDRFDRFGIRSHSMAAQIFYGVSEDFTLWGFLLQARLLLASKHLIQPLYVILQGWCCYHDVIDITHDEVLVFLCHTRECLGHQSLECCRRVAQSERYPLPLEQFQLAREARFLTILLSKWHLPERRAQI